MIRPTLLLLCGCLATSLCGAAPAPRGAANRAAAVRAEHQPIADQGDGTFHNPILPGHYHDPTVLRVGADYYLTHCENDHRGPLIWHSRDLVNWEPLARIAALARFNDIWATDLVFHQGRYYLYAPVRLATVDGRLTFTNVVVTASDPAGPWSEPVDLGVGGIDPGHVVDRDGTRYLYVNAGRVIQLAPDGLSTVGALRTVYAGWPIPADWAIECDCLESPKLFWRDGWCYLVSAAGGTAGPSTSHMIVVARSRSALGPWENAPDSPLLRTAARTEPWWSQGHGTFVEDPAGQWWVMYHAIQHGLRSLGRNTLLLPVTWDPEGWPHIPEGVTADSVLPKPVGDNVGPGLPLSDDFAGPTLGLQWDPLEHVPDFAAVYQLANGALHVVARGETAADATRLALLPVNRSYEITVEVTAPPGTRAGLGLFADRFTGIEFHDGGVRHPRRGDNFIPDLYPDGHVFLRVRNVDHDVTFYHSGDGATWTKFPWGAGASTESTQRAGFYAAGDGIVTFRSFTYQGLD